MTTAGRPPFDPATASLYVATAEEALALQARVIAQRCWSKRLSTRAGVALILLAAGYSQTEAASLSGLTRQRVHQLARPPVKDAWSRARRSGYTRRKRRAPRLRLARRFCPTVAGLPFA